MLLHVPYTRVRTVLLHVPNTRVRTVLLHVPNTGVRRCEYLIHEWVRYKYIFALLIYRLLASFDV